MHAVMMNAAQMSYRKAREKNRDKKNLRQNHPLWMQQFARALPEKEFEAERLEEDVERFKIRTLKNKPDKYSQFAWIVWSNITSKLWFEAFVMINIALIGIATGLDLEAGGKSAGMDTFVEVTSVFTMVVFTLEALLKIVSEGHEPRRYFTDKENGYFNTFDFLIVAAGFCFLGSTNGSAVSALRMLRLIRLLTFIKGVKQLRAIVAGLIQGMKSVTYIMVLLMLMIYLFAIMGVMLFGANDPVRFGTVGMAMVSLFQVSTLASWTSIAYTSWFGCDNYQGDPYAAAPLDVESQTRTSFGTFEGYKCDTNAPKPVLTFFFFSIYIVLTAWVIMSLFIGVISMGMFEAFEAMKEADKQKRARENFANNMHVSQAESDGTDGALVTKKDPKRPPSLRDLIDTALGEEEREVVDPGSWREKWLALATLCVRTRDSDYFNNLITATIITVGLFIGVDADRALHCERARLRLGFDDDDAASNPALDFACSEGVASYWVTVLSQAIFTVECTVKIIAEGDYPMRYLTDRANGAWNRLDLFVVVVGFLEMTPARVIFEFFPVVVLRLLRLLRVFRLAKALPRLRSIVEALMSGLSAVGWICVLIVVFNYIIACLCMLILRTNDPFHFGSVGRAMFTVLRIETLDSWDQILYVGMFGCDKYWAGYDFTALDTGPFGFRCQAAAASASAAADGGASRGLGYLGTLLFMTIVIFGAFVLPTTLIGIVAISFEDAANRSKLEQEVAGSVREVIEDAVAAHPDFFTQWRIEALKTVFNTLDADRELTLSLQEMEPFYHYVLFKLFAVDLNSEQAEALFHLMDMDGDTELGLAEFVTFISAVKSIEHKARADPAFREQAFPSLDLDVFEDTAAGVKKRAGMWARCVERQHNEAVREAWKSVVAYMGENSEDPKLVARHREMVRALFESYDTDENGKLDTPELVKGLSSVGISLLPDQAASLIKDLDQDGDGHISFDELLECVQRRTKAQEAADQVAKEAAALATIRQAEALRRTLRADALRGATRSITAEDVATAGTAQDTRAHLDDDRTAETASGHRLIGELKAALGGGESASHAITLHRRSISAGDLGPGVVLPLEGGVVETAAVDRHTTHPYAEGPPPPPPPGAPLAGDAALAADLADDADSEVPLDAVLRACAVRAARRMVLEADRRRGSDVQDAPLEGIDEGGGSAAGSSSSSSSSAAAAAHPLGRLRSKKVLEGPLAKLMLDRMRAEFHWLERCHNRTATNTTKAAAPLSSPSSRPRAAYPPPLQPGELPPRPSTPPLPPARDQGGGGGEAQDLRASVPSSSSSSAAAGHKRVDSLSAMHSIDGWADPPPPDLPAQRRAKLQAVWPLLYKNASGEVERLECWDALLEDKANAAALFGAGDPSLGTKVLECLKANRAIEVGSDGGYVPYWGFMRLADPGVVAAAQRQVSDGLGGLSGGLSGGLGGGYTQTGSSSVHGEELKEEPRGSGSPSSSRIQGNGVGVPPQRGTSDGSMGSSASSRTRGKAMAPARRYVTGSEASVTKSGHLPRRSSSPNHSPGPGGGGGGGWSAVGNRRSSTNPKKKPLTPRATMKSGSAPPALREKPTGHGGGAGNAGAVPLPGRAGSRLVARRANSHSERGTEWGRRLSGGGDHGGGGAGGGGNGEPPNLNRLAAQGQSGLLRNLSSQRLEGPNEVAETREPERQ